MVLKRYQGSFVHEIMDAGDNILCNDNIADHLLQVHNVYSERVRVERAQAESVWAFMRNEWIAVTSAYTYREQGEPPRCIHGLRRDDRIVPVVQGTGKRLLRGTLVMASTAQQSLIVREACARWVRTPPHLLSFGPLT